jgi:hypothetical protein
MTSILGISAYYHDAAAALVVDGDIVAAAQEERFTRRKHDWSFPGRAVAYCLDEAGLATKDLDYVVFYDKPFLTFERLLETYVSFAPRGFASFVRAMPLWFTEKLHLPREIRGQLGGGYTRRLAFVELPAPSSRPRSTRPPSSLSTGSASGRRRPWASAGGTACSCTPSCASRTRWGCSIRPSPTSPGSR